MRMQANPSRDLRRRASRLAFVLAAAALAGCGDHNATEPDDPTGDPVAQAGLAAQSAGDLRDPAALRSVDGSAVTTAVTRPPRSIFINPATGNDANAGTNLKPFKTLFKGLSIAISGDTLRLAAGTYNAGTGEKFTTATRQVTVPAGVKIFGAGPEQLTELRGASGDLVGLDLKGGAVIRSVQLTGFVTGIRASQGTQTLKGVNINQSRHGLTLSGSAKATLTQSLFFVSPDPQNLPVTGIELFQQAQLVLDGGNVVGDSKTCALSTRGMTMSGASRATLKNSVTFHDFTGQGITLSQTAKLTMTGFARVDRFLGSLSCAVKPQIEMHDSSTLTLASAFVSSQGGSPGRGILSDSKGLVSLDSAQVLGHAGAGIVLQGAARRLTISKSDILNNGTGIDAGALTDVDLLVVSANVSQNSIGISAPFVKLRSSQVSQNGIGVLITRSDRFSDLGQTFDPGRNIITKNQLSGVEFGLPVINNGFGAVFASGNTWNALTQQANGSGLYPSQPLVTADSPNARGTNFVMPNASGLFEIQL